MWIGRQPNATPKMGGGRSGPVGKILEAPRRSVKPGLRPSPRSALLSLPASSPIFLMKVPYFDLPAQIRALRPELDAAIARTLDACSFCLGPDVAEFERAFAAFTGAAHCIGYKMPG